MDRRSMKHLRLDRRLIDRADWISPQELEAELAALPDASHKSMTVGQAEDEVKPPAEKVPAPAAGDLLPPEE